MIHDGLVLQVYLPKRWKKAETEICIFLLNLKVVSILIPLEICRIKEMKMCWICKALFTCIKIRKVLQDLICARIKFVQLVQEEDLETVPVEVQLTLHSAIL